MELYNYFRSSAAYRVRIALNLKEVAYTQLPVNLQRGEQNHPQYKQVQPQGLVPALRDQGAVLLQSLAICEYLEEVYPERSPLLPVNRVDRARVRAISEIIACDIHPVNNLRVLNYLSQCLDIGEQEKISWYQHWIEEGFLALEQLLTGEEYPGKFCFGDTPGLADLCLVPQMFNARRFGVDMAPYPELLRIESNCQSLPAFADAHPDNCSH